MEDKIIQLIEYKGMLIGLSEKGELYYAEGYDTKNLHWYKMIKPNLY